MEEWADFTGQFEARESVEVRARVSGYLESVNFTDGQLVKKGDLLFVIEPRPFELALETSKAQLAQTEAQVQLAQQQLDRTAQLRKNDYATKETYDERVSQVAIATASRDAASAAVNQAQLNLDYTRVTAPVSGRMGRHEVSVGNLVMGGITGNTTLLTTIVSLDPIWLTFNVSEGDGMTYKRLVQKGEIKSARDNAVEVQGQLMDEKTWTLKGTIDFVDNQYDRSSGTIRVRAAVPQSQLVHHSGPVRPGARADVAAPSDHPRARRRGGDRPVGQAAVHGQRRTAPWCRSRSSSVRSPTTILRVIRTGITADDQVIINGLLRARPGAKVTPEEGKIEPQAAPRRITPAHEHFAFLHRPADLRGGHLHSHHADRRRGLSQPAGGAISRDRAALDLGQRQLSRRLGRDRRQDRGHAARAGDQRRRQHALHDVAIDQRRLRCRWRSRSSSAPISIPRRCWCRTGCRPRCRVCLTKCARSA